MAIITFEVVAAGNDFCAMRASGEAGDLYHIDIPERGSVPFAFLTKGKTKLLDKNFEPHPMGNYPIRTRAIPPPGLITVCALEPLEWVCITHNDNLWVTGELTELSIREELIVLKDKHIFIAEGSVKLNGRTKKIDTMLHVVSGDVILIGEENSLILVFEITKL